MICKNYLLHPRATVDIHSGRSKERVQRNRNRNQRNERNRNMLLLSITIISLLLFILLETALVTIDAITLRCNILLTSIRKRATLSLHQRFTLWYYSSEEGMTVIQLGYLLLEWSHNQPRKLLLQCNRVYDIQADEVNEQTNP